MAPVVVMTIPIVPVTISQLIAVAKAATKILALAWRETRVLEIPVPTRIGRQAVVDIVPGCVEAGMEPLALEIVISRRRLLPAKVDADLSVCPWHSQRSYRQPRHQSGGRKRGKCGS
jgi:hypothetical protein